MYGKKVNFDLRAGIKTILEAPLDYSRFGPLADELMHQGDSRGEMLSLWPKVVSACRDLKPIDGMLAAHTIHQNLRHWYVCMIARHTSNNQKMIYEDQTPETHVAVTAGILHACKLIDDETLFATGVGCDRTSRHIEPNDTGRWAAISAAYWAAAATMSEMAMHNAAAWACVWSKNSWHVAVAKWFASDLELPKRLRELFKEL